MLHSDLSWTHYRTLLRVDRSEARAFYEIESLKNKWSARELERQINSLLYERLARSRDKRGLMRLAVRGQEIAKPADIFKDPVVIEFVGPPESHDWLRLGLKRRSSTTCKRFFLSSAPGSRLWPDKSELLWTATTSTSILFSIIRY